MQAASTEWACDTKFQHVMQAPNASFEQQASGELLKLIWKLRWLGEDDDANKARTQLNRILARLQVLGGVPCAAITFGIPNDTD